MDQNATGGNTSKFLHFLGKAEGADYNVITGGKTFTDFSKHPNTVGVRTKDGPSTAAGKYQITKPTYDEFAPKLGITDFSPASQDRIALAIIEQAGAKGNIESGDYTGAINKLGGRWASLPSSKYGQPARSWEWVSKNLDGTTAPGMSSQFTTGQEQSPSLGGPSASELYRESQQRDAEYGGVWNNVVNLPSAIRTGFQVDNSVYNFWQERGLSQVDQNFKWDEANTKQFLEGVPQRHWDYILQSKSTGEATLRKSRMVDTLEKEQELGRMGVAGFGGRLIGNLVDIPTVLSFVPGAGGASLLSKTSRIANAARMALIGGASNVAFDAATMSQRPTATTDDLYFSAAMGLGLGGIAGAAINPKRLALAAENVALQKHGMREAGKAQVKELDDLGFTPGPGRAAYLERTSGEAPGVNIGPMARATDDIPEGALRAPEVDPVAARIRDEPVPTFTKTNTATKAVVGLEEGSMKARLGGLKTSSDALVSKLAARLESQVGDDVPVVLRTPSTRSYYDPVKHEIHLRKDAPDWEALHEISHAVTANKIRFGEANPTTAHGELVSSLKEVFETAKAKAETTTFKDEKSSYYLSNLDEFVAGMYSGKSEFIDFLSKVAAPSGGNVLKKVVEVFRKILGMDPGEANALTRAMGITDDIINTPLKVDQTIIGLDGQKLKSSYLMSPDSKVDADTVEAANRAEIPTVFGWGLGLENRLGGAKAPAAVRSLASKLFGTTVGYKDHTVVRANAFEDTTKWADSWAIEMRKGTYPQFFDWLKTSEKYPHYHQQGEAFEDFGTQVSNFIRGVDGDYPPQVVKAGEHMRKSLANTVEYINNPLFDEGLIKKGLTEVEIQDAKTGALSLVGKLEKDPNYLPRKHDINKWNDMANSYGRDAVEGWWARAYQAGRQGISDEAAVKWAKWYTRTVEEAHANRSQDLLEDMMRGTDKDALKMSLKTNGGFDDAGAQKIMDDMFPTVAKASKDVGRISSLKHRNTINETHMETWTKPDGTKVEVGLNDFIHANAFNVVEPYLRRTAGSVALAKHLDIYKTNHIDDAIMDATTNKLGSEFKNQAELAKYRKDLKFAFERIQGLPQEDFTAFNKAMAMWRDFNVIRMMGGAVWNQATEASQIVGTMGWKTTLRAIPELRALKRDIATGRAPNDILDHLENTIGGVGSEYVARLDFKASDDWVRHKGDTAFNRKLDALDTGVKKMAKGVLDYTGMTPLMVQQKRVHAVALVNHFVKAAQEGKASSFMTPERMAWMGMGEGDLKNVLAALKKHTKEADGEFSKSHKMDFTGFAKENPQEYSKFMTAIHRESRRAVQENDLASMIPLMGTTLGKTVFQFMNFSMHGWNKSLMFAMNHRDWTTLSTVLHGSLFASIAYMGRTMLSSGGMDAEKRQEFLDKRMGPGQIVANSFGRLAQASLLPVAFDTISPFPMFNGMRTTSDLSSFASNPTYQAINGLISMKKLIRNGVSDDYQTTEKDMRTWGKLLPLNNVYPISGILNSLANDYPNSEDQ